MPEREDGEKKTSRGAQPSELSTSPCSKGGSSPSTIHGSSATSKSHPDGLYNPEAVSFAIATRRDAKIFAKRYRTELAAGSSSLISTFVTYPLDFVKSRMQIYRGGFLHTARDAYRGEGFRMFWRGVGPPLVSVTAVRTLSFSIYQKAKYTFDDYISRVTGESPLQTANARGSFPTAATLICFAAAGATSGAIITTFSCPFELTKLSQQIAGKLERGEGGDKANSQQGLFGKRSWETARRMMRERGVAGLYSGYRLHLLRDTVGTALYFTTYESAKQILANARGQSPTSPYAVVVAGGLCGIVSWVCIYPLDVAKTVYQKALLTAQGRPTKMPPIRFLQPGSYRGLGVSVLRSCIINMIFFSHFELLKKRINALEVD